MKRRLPLSITTFSEIREQNYLYVDKTAQIQQMVEHGKYYFLSRPRRFGKSLLLDTMSELFQGNQILFEGLAVHDQWEWGQCYPVIKMDLNLGDFSSTEGIKRAIRNILGQNRQVHQVECESREDIPAYFNELIEKVTQKHQQPVVILVDEYDKPILDNIHDQVLAAEARAILKSFYSTIKSNDRHLKFVFLTGVSKFSKMNLFSGLNNLTDITVDERYATLCGYTHQNIETIFAEHLEGVDLEELKRWYNGYNYLGEPVYNPYDVLLFIEKGCQYANYWWGTGNPGFLVEKLREQNYNIPQLEEIEVTPELLDTFDVENIDLIALLWQTGYLTFERKITKRNSIFYKLKLPNREIQESLNILFIKFLTNQTVDTVRNQDYIDGALTGEISQLEQALTSLFASIPYANYVNNLISKYEGYYASVVFTYIMSLGYPCIPEDVTNKGRVDLTIKLPGRIVVLEFKVDQTEPALTQIKEKKYYQKYQAEAQANHQEIYMVGIGFSSQEKNITGFDWEIVS